MSDPSKDDWENDSVWKLIDEASVPEAGPFFVRNVMREVRLAEEPSPWWQRLFTPKALGAGALAAAAAVAIVVSLDLGGSKGDGIAQTPDPAPTLKVQVSTLAEEELLLAASEDPTVFSDEALVAMLY